MLLSNVSSDALIGFEYNIPVGGRIDCVLFGHGQDGAANMIHIELKQWSNDNVSEHYNGYTFCTELSVEGGRQPKYASHPSAQALEYQNHLLNHVYAFKDEKINLYGLRTATIISQRVKILYCAIVHTITSQTNVHSIVLTKPQNSPKSLISLLV